MDRYNRAEREQKFIDIFGHRLADRKAAALLWSHLDEAQRGQLLHQGDFFVTGNESGRLYRVAAGRGSNVHWHDHKTGIVYVMDAHLSQSWPLADTILAQKLALEANEQAFRKKACCFPAGMCGAGRANTRMVFWCRIAATGLAIGTWVAISVALQYLFPILRTAAH